MSIGLLGKKVGMTRVFNEDGDAVAVTVVDVSDNVIVQLRTSEKDGYSAVQVEYDSQKPSRVKSPRRGHFAKWNAEPKRFVREFRVENDEALPDPETFELGADLFEEGQMVDVIGTSKGKGFQGVYKRYGFGGLPSSHGSMMHRRPGSVGAGTWPGRIWKNTKMPGHEGDERITVQNLQIVKTRPDDNVLLISGAVPGAKGGYVVVRPAIKNKEAQEDKK